MTTDKTLWIGNINKEFIDKTHWAKLRVKTDTKVNEKYIDILIGQKGKQWHAHIGINLDQSLKFERYRGVVHSIIREVKSQKRGLLENTKLVVDPTISKVRTLILEINMDGNTREVSIQEFKLR
jgi:hypothetical protein